MPRYRIACLGDTWFEISADTEADATRRFWNMKVSDLGQQCELNVHDPELIREEQPLRSIRPYLTPVS